MSCQAKFGFQISRVCGNVESFCYVRRGNKRKIVINEPFFIPFRKYGLCSSMSASERAKLIEMKAQMVQKIQALEQQIFLEEIKLLARNHSPQEPFKDSR